MSQVVSAAALALLVALAWALGRPRPRLLRSCDATAVAALNRAQISRLAPAPPPVSSPLLTATAEPLPVLPAAGGERQRVLRLWQASLRGACEQRRRIVLASAASGDPAVLPLLRQALRDPDPTIVAAAAAALASFRRRSATDGAAQAPRNVARMR